MLFSIGNIKLSPVAFVSQPNIPLTFSNKGYFFAGENCTVNFLPGILPYLKVLFLLEILIKVETRGDICIPADKGQASCYNWHFSLLFLIHHTAPILRCLTF